MARSACRRASVEGGPPTRTRWLNPALTLWNPKALQQVTLAASHGRKLTSECSTRVLGFQQRCRSVNTCLATVRDTQRDGAWGHTALVADTVRTCSAVAEGRMFRPASCELFVRRGMLHYNGGFYGILYV
jgi:hypothetical protein